ncbi:MAG: hypothetical protein AB7V42_05110 [Thermoleophilia bacterium]
MTDEEGARAQVRRLLLSGDNSLKNRHDGPARERARRRYEEALATARAAGLDAGLVEIIERRLDATDPSASDV